MSVVTIKNLSKIYRSERKDSPVTHALNNISLEVSSGGIFALLGRNGAGKSTLTKILMGLVFPTSGTAEIMGISVMEPGSRKHIGYLEETPKFPSELRLRDLMKISGGLSGLSTSQVQKKTHDLVGLLRLEEWVGKRIGQCSKGVVQRIGLANALIGGPSLLLLDEPTDGLDPVIRKDVRDYLKSLPQSGITICMTSHILSEVEQMADRVAIIDKGVIVKSGSLGDLLPRSQAAVIVADRIVPEGTVPPEKINAHVQLGNKSKFTVPDEFVNDVVDRLREQGVRIDSVTKVSIGLEEYFIDVINTEERP